MFALFAAAALSAGCPHECDCADDAPIRVTVTVILASTESKVVDPKLTDLAAEVQKRDKKLTGFKVVETIGKSIPVGESAKFTLVDKQELKVKIEKSKDEKGRVGLTVKPPELGEITYTCSCEKFFPIVTPYKTKAGETLIIMVMAKPCTMKK